MNNKEQGKRYNSGKVQWSQLDFKALEPMVRVLEHGAAKYDKYNWKKGMSHTEICESLLRHLFAYLDGEDLDKESGLQHVSHVLSNAMFLQYNVDNKPEYDDRYKK